MAILSGPGLGSDSVKSGDVFTLEGEAHGLAERLPDLQLEAQRISATVAHGIHGRRRAGPGETFWQFRQYGDGDATTAIDWRRSASSDHVYIREREWEAAHTVWLWPDLSDSMKFHSHLSDTLKRDRALVLTLALGELLVRGGERVALLGLTRPSASRKATTLMAEAIASNADAPQLQASLPPQERIGRFSGVILIGDFLDPAEKVTERIQLLAASGCNGHIIQVLDPAEETLPYSGRAEFVGLEGDERWVADRAETLREDYRGALLAHRAAIQETARRLGWSFLLHHTDRPASDVLLSLIMRMTVGAGGNYRFDAGADASDAGGKGGAL